MINIPMRDSQDLRNAISEPCWTLTYDTLTKQYVVLPGDMREWVALHCPGTTAEIYKDYPKV